MSITTLNGDYCTLSSASISTGMLKPDSNGLFHTNFTIQCRIKNEHTKTISNLRMVSLFRQDTTHVLTLFPQSVVVASPTSIKNGTTATVTFTFDVQSYQGASETVQYLRDNELRAAESFAFNIFADRNGTEILVGSINIEDDLIVLDQTYNPRIVNFSCQRVDDSMQLNDEGNYLKVTASWDYNLATPTISTTFLIKVYYKRSSESEYPFSSIDLSRYLTNKGYTGVLTEYDEQSERDVPIEFSSGESWDLELEFFEQYEQTASVETDAPRAFANVHLSGSINGGVAFGKFSASTPQNPMFECAYPMYALGGIEGLTNFHFSPTDTSGQYACTTRIGDYYLSSVDRGDVYQTMIYDTRSHNFSNSANWDMFLVTDTSIFPHGKPDFLIELTGCYLAGDGGMTMISRYQSSSQYLNGYINTSNYIRLHGAGLTVSKILLKLVYFKKSSILT